ncbi:hypothetical protein G6F56_008465 [Rhizopus delemar]|nr:hypothetical protein G6F56_008465 [Rhizopus delemar]
MENYQINKNNRIVNFYNENLYCALCDFRATYPSEYKRHVLSVSHVQRSTAENERIYPEFSEAQIGGASTGPQYMELSQPETYLNVQNDTEEEEEVTGNFLYDGSSDGYFGGADYSSVGSFDHFHNVLNEETSSDGSSSSSVTDVEDNPHENSSFPFKNEYTLTAILHFKASSKHYSEEEIKSTLEFGKRMAEIALEEYKQQLSLDATNTEYSLKNYPTPHSVYRYHKSRKSNIPEFKHAEYRVNGTDKPDLTVNHVSEHLRVLLGIPLMSTHLSDLPDHTPNQRIKLSQGEKWIASKEFQHPMILTNYGSGQLWVADRIALLCDESLRVEERPLYKVAKIFQESKITKVDVYRIFTQENDPMVYISSQAFSVSVEEIDHSTIDRSENEDIRFYASVNHDLISQQLTLCSSELVPETQLLKPHCDMFEIGHSFKRPLPLNSQFTTNILDTRYPKNYMVVRNVPYSLFSDDTSRNSYDTWSLNPAAVPLSIANHYLNQLFICGSNKLSAMDQLSFLVDDLECLEKGLTMFDATLKEDVFVIAPLLFIEADNPRHAEITCIKQSTASYTAAQRCRFFPAPRRKPAPNLHLSYKTQTQLFSPKLVSCQSPCKS